jgi:hypothetical protein
MTVFPGYAVLPRQFGHGGQPLAGLPFPGAEPPAQVVIDLARGQLRSPWWHGVHDRKLRSPRVPALLVGVVQGMADGLALA